MMEKKVELQMMRYREYKNKFQDKNKSPHQAHILDYKK